MAQLQLTLFSIILLLASASIVPLLIRDQSFLILISFALAACSSFIIIISGAWTVAANSITSITIPLGLPDLPFHLRLDPLSGFFLTIIGLLGFCVSIYSIGYCKEFINKRSIYSLVIFYQIFLTGMILVVLADDALFFMISWEIMAGASYFLVMFEDERPENRKGAYIYIVMAHIGAIAILLSFGIMAGRATGFESFNGYTFDAIRQTNFTIGWGTAAFLLAFFGFAAKAGMIPLHVWLPEAHPVAPSNVSALMSGIMLKTAIYGIIRVVYDLIRLFPWWWGGMVLIFGLITALLGILYANLEHDLKRLLAYSSVENIGIILIGLGLSIGFTAFQKPLLSALALTAALYHTLNHAMFKGLLFMGAGAVLHSTKKRNMEELGGLIHHMPWTAAFFLIGCISISALPPFNGFVSEWLTFQAFLLSPSLPSPLLNLMIPMGAALLALTGALSAACFVKAFGVTFLGHWRGHQNIHIHEVNWPMRIGMMLTSTICLGLGIFPTLVIDWMDVLSDQLVGAKISTTAGEYGWFWLTPVSHEQASYSGPIVFVVIISVIAIVYSLLHARKKAIHRVPIWDCGFEKITSRMQYNAISFSMPIRRIFGFLFNVREEVTLSNNGSLRYRLRIRDYFWIWIYKPVAESAYWISRKIVFMQQGRIQVYLIYSFITIIVLLVFLR